MPEEKIQNEVIVPEETLPVLSSARDLFDQVDTGELVAELRRRVTGAWAYEFPMDGKPVRGLSASGARESASFIAHQTKGQLVIRPIELVKVEEEIDCFKATVKAGLYVVGVDRSTGKSIELLLSTSFGYAKQPKYGTRKDGSQWTIVHAEVMAVSKAERNAIGHLIPDKIKTAILETALHEGRIEPENEPQINGKTPPSQNGEVGATIKQVNYIQKMLKSSKVTEQHRTDFKKAFDKGLTSKQASNWIQHLQKIVGKEENGDLPL